MEVCEGIKDHCVRDSSDASDTRWEYTYHQRLFGYSVPGLENQIDQIEGIFVSLPPLTSTGSGRSTLNDDDPSLKVMSREKVQRVSNIGSV